MKNLKQKLIEVSKAIVYLKKDKQNKMQGYNYLSEAKIKAVIKAEFEKQGILFNYSTDIVNHYEISPTHKGTKQFCTIVTGRYSFIDVDHDERIDGMWAGSGTDTGDKGLYKAITGGIKYVMNTNFLIPTGDDPEDDHDINGGDSKMQEIQSPQSPQSPQPPKTTGKGITAKQEDKLQQIRKSHLINEDEKVEIQKIIGQKDGIKASEKIKDWFGEDWKGGERQRREYIELYVKMRSKDTGEPPKELIENFKTEAKVTIDGLDPSKIGVLIKELQQEE